MLGSPVIVAQIPSIAIFVRHSRECPNRADELHRRCKCPKHLRWTAGRKQYRQSAKTRAWTIAEERRRALEAQFAAADPTKPVPTPVLESKSRPTIEQAVELFISYKRSEGVGPEFMAKYERELKRLVEFASTRSRFFPHEIDLSLMTEFRQGWDDLYPSSLTRSKVQERLRGFLRYCLEAAMTDRIPKLSAIRISVPPTLPLDKGEYQRLLEAVDEEFSGVKAQRTRALIQLMRYTGLAIRDAVTLERSEFKHDSRSDSWRIVTSRQKTGTHVSVLLPPAIAQELAAAMELNASKRYVFWKTGLGTERTATTNWSDELRRVFKRAGLVGGHPHQLRDTFAVELLQKGVPLEEVSKLLGHQSIRVTEKHYAQWVQARQDRLDSLVMNAW